MRKILIVLCLTILLVTSYSNTTAHEPDLIQNTVAIESKTITYEPIMTTDGIKINKLSSIEVTNTVQRSVTKSIDSAAGTNIVITFNMWRAIRGQTDWMGYFSAWVEGRSRLSIQADYIHVFVRHYYGNPGSCNLPVANGEKTAYNATEAFAASPKYNYKTGLQHCVKYAEHDAVYSLYGGGSFHYTAMDNPNGILP